SYGALSFHRQAEFPEPKRTGRVAEEGAGHPDRGYPHGAAAVAALHRGLGRLWVGMADVQFLKGALVVASVAKATDAAARDLGPAAVAVWLLAAALLMIRYRIGALFLAAIAFSAALFWDGATNHVVFLGWMALIVGLLPE